MTTASRDSRIASPATGIGRNPFGVRVANLDPGFALNTPLQRTVVGLVDQGRSVPCDHDYSFTADDKATRARAELLCIGCPALTACDQDATTRGEHHHVWGGKDRTPGAHPVEDAS